MIGLNLNLWEKFVGIKLK